MKLLLAEDDRASRLILARTLERWGYTVISAADGDEALRLVRPSGARIVVSDWEMPGLDGPALCRALRQEREPYLYLVLLTSHRDPTHLVEGLDAGADDFVAKPFDPAELRARLNVGRRILGLQDELTTRAEALRRAVDALSKIAATDPLLGIGNRRAFEEYVGALGAGPYGLLLADVDHFKDVNDAFGHLAGDRVLVQVATSARDAIGAAGEVFRYGGEEIVAVLPGADLAAVRERGEALRVAVAEREVVFSDGRARGVTISVGGTVRGAGEATVTTVVGRADDALYEAKHQGRNRFVVR